MADRLAAEARFVEDGQRTRRITDWHYTVKGRDFPDETYNVTVSFVSHVPLFRCDCIAGRVGNLCKHTQGVARRLEREGRIQLTEHDTWEVVRVEPTTAQPDDPFDRLEF